MMQFPGRWIGEGVLKSLEKKSKKLVYISEALLDAIGEISRRKGASVTKYIEDLLKQAERIDRLGFDTEELADLLGMIHVHRVLGSVFFPQEVVNSTSFKSLTNDELLQKWYESGKLYGRYVREKFPDPLRMLQLMLRVMRWDLNEVEAVRTENLVTFRCVSTSLSNEGAEWLSRFIEGAMHSFGYRTLNGDRMKGLVVFTFEALRQ